MKRIAKKVRAWVLITLIAGGSILSYSFVENSHFFEITKNLDIFATMFKELNTYYVDEVDPDRVMKTGIDAMLESLDPYTDYYPESEIEDYRLMTTGQYGGIGASVTQRGDDVIIAEPYEGYAAQKADLRPGDIIQEIDGRSIKGKRFDEISKILKGQPKTIVKLLIKRGEDKPFIKEIPREDIKIKNVPYYGMLNDDFGYIKLKGFTENASYEVKEALMKLKETGKLKGVVLDLRDNPGGLLHEAVNISNLFVDKGLDIVSTRGKVKEWDKVYKSINQPVDASLPVVLLVNSGSASASEIVSGSLQDLDRAVIVGQRTFGKGLVQTTRPLSYNSTLKLTTAKYYVPSGRCIQAIDYSNRNADGSVGKIPDSLISKFKTKNGRVVMDGGGILPDVAVEPLKNSNIASSLANKWLFFDYASMYKANHPSIPAAKSFRLSEDDYQKFVAYLSDKEYDYTTRSERTLEDLKTTASNEKYFEDIKAEYEALHKKMMHNKKEDLVKNKEEISEILQEEICARYYLQSGRVESSLSSDPEVKKALEVLADNNLYTSILKGTYQQAKK